MDNERVLLEPSLSKGIVPEVPPYEVGKSLIEFGTSFVEAAGADIRNNHNKEGPTKRQRSETEEEEEEPNNFKYFKSECLKEYIEPSPTRNNYTLPSISTFFPLDTDISAPSLSNSTRLPCLKEALSGPSKLNIIEAEVLEPLRTPPKKKKKARAHKVPSWALLRLRRWFTCGVKGCHKSFSDEKDLLYHTNVHHSTEQAPDASSGVHGSLDGSS